MPDMGITHGDEVGNAARRSSQVERESIPNVTVNKAMLAIVVDSLEVSFTRYGGNVWKYDSGASRPVLAPLINTRSASSKEDEDTSWRPFFDQLVESLPVDVAARLTLENGLQKSERNSSYTALNDLLVGTAKFLNWVEFASDIRESERKEESKERLLADIAKDNLNPIAKEYLREAFKFLDHVGPNYAHYDKLSNNLKQMEVGLNRMEKDDS